MHAGRNPEKLVERLLQSEGVHAAVHLGYPPYPREQDPQVVWSNATGQVLQLAPCHMLLQVHVHPVEALPDTSLALLLQFHALVQL
jgi:riboflavin synthase